jgi:hypothetical protein
MTWVAWRQQRALLLLFAALASAGAVTAVYLSAGMQSFIASHHLAGCVLNPQCDVPDGADSSFTDQYANLFHLATLLMLAAPVTVGLFLGAPLFAREFENRTHLLALGQAATKIAVAVVPALLGVAVLTFAHTRMTHVAGELLRPSSRFTTTSFEAQGLMPVAYTLYALVAGVAFGLLLRNTVAAFGATMGLFVVARIALQVARPHLLAPTLLTGPILGGGQLYPQLPAGSLLVHGGYLDKAGKLVSEEALPEACRTLGAGWQPVGDGAGTGVDLPGCLRGHGFVGTAQYFHGPDHYWILQLIEGGILLALAAALLAAAVWRFRARLR